MNINKSVGIIGCGWLGQALASQLLQNNYYVVGTATSLERLAQISSLGAISEQLTLPLELADKNSYQCFDCQSLIIAITPQLRSGKVDYPKKIAQVVAKAQQGKVKQIILINSTAIYGGLKGDVTETSPLDLSQPKVETLLEAENIIFNSGIHAVSLRVAGLVGPNRLPGNFFKPGLSLKEPNAYVNLIHQADIVSCITHLIANVEITGVYNVASAMKVSKLEFYHKAALSLGKTPPEFETPNTMPTNKGKFVVSNKIRQVLPFQFKYDDLQAWL
ncbi:NAD(P)-binding domain-containing protein [Thalassotalea profundi]|uniref:NAD(P)-dependent oxidoreductase n=1 Tax=Thalassotalea profundi TaxID=2036687 RepID=A0ABQ3IYX9_9GAMM|nr:NAD(P)-binding domain-containing protein [Thalassotalea profundi]GHE94089.1 NAD(P)-dependent oxidoreductase [Thalassotalea profundi]